MPRCVNCGAEIEGTASSCWNCGAEFVQEGVDSQPSEGQPRQQYQQPPQRRQKKPFYKKTPFILLIVLLIVGAGTGVVYFSFIREPTGNIEVMYDSTLNNDVWIYLDDESLERISPNEWVTFENIEAGNYTIKAENLDGDLVDREDITVSGGETTTVELEAIGDIEVKYNSALDNDVQIYLDDEFLERITSDEWVTFENIEAGTYTIKAENLDDNLVDSEYITVSEGKTTSVELEAIGDIEVVYTSALDNDVRIYLDDDFLERISPDEWVTFENIEAGTYTIKAENLEGDLVDSEYITVSGGRTTTVELEATGSIWVYYDSVWGNDVMIYVEKGNRVVHSEQIPSDEWVYLGEFDAGEYEITAADLDNNYLDSEEIILEGGKTENVQLSYW